jgi:hypothetical protein
MAGPAHAAGRWRKPPGHRPLSAAADVASTVCVVRITGSRRPGVRKQGLGPAGFSGLALARDGRACGRSGALAVARWLLGRSCGARAWPSWPAQGARPTRRRLPCRLEGTLPGKTHDLGRIFGVDGQHSVSVTRPVLRRRSTCRRAAIASLSLGSMVFSWTAVGKGVRCQCARGVARCPSRSARRTRPHAGPRVCGSRSAAKRS